MATAVAEAEVAEKPPEEEAQSGATTPAEPAAEAAAEPDAEPAAEPVRPIIKKIIVEEGHGGAHGGAWKIALADMMTAMMAFFLLMWLLGASNEDQKRSVADYFRPTSHSQIVFGELAGSQGMFGGASIVDTDGFPFSAKQTGMLERLTPQAQGGPSDGYGASKEDVNREGPQEDSPRSEPGSSSRKQDKTDAQFEQMAKEIEQRLAENKNLQNLKDQVSVTREKDGLRIEILDKADFAMFTLGTAEVTGRAQALVKEITKTLKTVPNSISVRGHTDSLSFGKSEAYRNNWLLSAERADSTRQLMQAEGISAKRFSRIEGVADTNPKAPDNPADPRNRRISITVLNQ
ncbi:MAG: Motility protein [Pseudomonadota bacterium]|jgi:chemotaxis protein MotB